MERMIFHPHYCYDCHRDYISKHLLAPCYWCGGTNVTNWRKDVYDMNKKTITCYNCKHFNNCMPYLSRIFGEKEWLTSKLKDKRKFNNDVLRMLARNCKDRKDKNA